MDKIGPIARTVEDCALIFEAIHGWDGHDPTTVDRPFSWPPRLDIRKLRVGYIESPPPAAGRSAPERAELKVLKDLGVQLVPIKLPDRYPVGPLTMILSVEAATVFDELTRTGRTEGLNTWPASFRQAEFVPAVEYLRAGRIRSLVMREMHQVMQQVDLYLGGNDLVLANLTGHPTVVLPNGFREQDGNVTPLSLTFTGRLYGERELLAVADAYQRATGHHKRRPTLTSND
jgi:Asp-tRNA(Asn)/Glu-tRNA(Gln) amidotransferase A subunit family amidase